MATILNVLNVHSKYLLKLYYEKAGQFNKILPQFCQVTSISANMHLCVCALFYSHLLSPSLFVFLAQEGFHWVLSLKNGSGYRDKALFLSESNFQCYPTGNTAHSNDTEFSKHLYKQLSPDLTSDRSEQWDKGKHGITGHWQNRYETKAKKEKLMIVINAKVKWNRSMNATPIGCALHAFSCQSIPHYIPSYRG